MLSKYQTADLSDKDFFGILKLHKYSLLNKNTTNKQKKHHLSGCEHKILFFLIIIMLNEEKLRIKLK